MSDGSSSDYVPALECPLDSLGYSRCPPTLSAEKRAFLVPFAPTATEQSLVLNVVVKVLWNIAVNDVDPTIANVKGAFY